MTDPICERCGEARSKHALANFADGPMIGDAALVCPTALFLEHQHKAFALVRCDTARLCACGATSDIGPDASGEWSKR